MEGASGTDVIMGCEHAVSHKRKLSELDDNILMPAGPQKTPIYGSFYRAHSVNLFGLEALRADMLEYRGIFPDHVLQQQVAPKFQLAVLQEDVRLSSIFPEFARTAIDQIVLTNVILTRQVSWKSLPLVLPLSSISDIWPSRDLGCRSSFRSRPYIRREMR
jgi:hypothetical protein